MKKPKWQWVRRQNGMLASIRQRLLWKHKIVGASVGVRFSGQDIIIQASFDRADILPMQEMLLTEMEMLSSSYMGLAKSRVRVFLNKVDAHNTIMRALLGKQTTHPYWNDDAGNVVRTTLVTP